VNNVKPTIKQRKALSNLAENGGNKGKAMRDAGYSEVSSKTPTKLTESRGWETLLKEELPDDFLLDKHKKLLNKKETRLKNNVTTGKIEVIRTKEIDSTSVAKGLDMAYKIKKKYDDKLKLGFDGVSTEELKERAAQLIAGVISNKQGAPN